MKSLDHKASIYVVLSAPLLPRPFDGQHPVLEHPLSVFLPKCERPSLTSKWMLGGIGNYIG